MLICQLRIEEVRVGLVVKKPDRLGVITFHYHQDGYPQYWKIRWSGDSCASEYVKDYMLCAYAVILKDDEPLYVNELLVDF